MRIQYNRLFPSSVRVRVYSEIMGLVVLKLPLFISNLHVCMYVYMYVVHGLRCVPAGSGNRLPSFQDYGRQIDGIFYQHQAIIPSYKFRDCFMTCANITKWGVDVNLGGGMDQGEYTLDLQVWRPSPTVDNSTGAGYYGLVGNNRFTSISLSDQVVVVTPSPQGYIQFQPGDYLACLWKKPGGTMVEL